MRTIRKIQLRFLTACLLGSLAVAVQAQSVTQVDSNDIVCEAPFVNRARYHYGPIVTRHSNTPSGVYKSGIIFLADQLERNVDPQEKTRPMVVTSFASLDNLQETSA